MEMKQLIKYVLSRTITCQPNGDLYLAFCCAYHPTDDTAFAPHTTNECGVGSLI